MVLLLQNIFNFLFNTSGVDLRVLAAEDKQKEVRGSPLMRFVGQDLSGSSGPNTIEGIMNGVIKEKLKIIPKNLKWVSISFAVSHHNDQHNCPNHVRTLIFSIYYCPNHPPHP